MSVPPGDTVELFKFIEIMTAYFLTLSFFKEFAIFLKKGEKFKLRSYERVKKQTKKPLKNRPFYKRGKKRALYVLRRYIWLPKM